MFAGLCVGIAVQADSLATDVILTVALIAPPVSIGVAMVRHQLFDVGFALNRTIVFVSLSAIVVGCYGLGVLALGSAATTSAPGLLLVAGAALLAASGRSVVQRSVDRWLFGLGRDPYAVVARVGRHIEPASEPVEALELLVEALRRALRLPYVAFAGGAVRVAAGTATADVHVVATRALGQDMGELLVGRRRRAERFSPDELAAIDEVAARAGTLAYAAGLVADITDSRARIVVAREEERRRLRADLHDGVGPALAGTAHQLDALARRIDAGGAPELAERAREIRNRLRDTVGDIRAVVHGLRPPVLDQIGLSGALRQLTDGLDRPRAESRIGDLGDLPAAVEVAAYSIAAEAVANTLRHAAAARLVVIARRDDDVLIVEVADDGCGLPARPVAGVGLRSMGERAVEVGGRLDLLPNQPGGTIVRAQLPAPATRARPSSAELAEV
jgi:signal transduction histidine kinase